MDKITDDATKEALKKKDPATEKKIYNYYFYFLFFSILGLAFFLWLYNLERTYQGHKIIGMIGIFLFALLTVSTLGLIVEGLVEKFKKK